MNYVLLVEDDPRLSRLVSDFLVSQGFQVSSMSDGSRLLYSIKQKKPDIIVLDVMLPGEDGFTLCRKIRPLYQGPLLFMTAKDDDFDQVMGLELGADDYVIKPVEPRVLLARIHALLRRTKDHSLISPELEQKLTFGSLSIDKRSRQVILGNEEVQLTSHEFDMLWKLAQNASQVVERTTLYTELIGREYDGLDRSADVRISRLRKKLKDNQQNPYRIKTIWGKGFFFVADAWD
jgi:DNA-binding response OmpR family regulator